MAYKHMLLTLIVVYNLLGFCMAEEPFLWKQMIDVSNKHFENAFLPSYIDLQNEVINSTWISPECNKQIRSALDSLSTRHNWATKLFNSWAKFPPSGALRGTLTDFGDYDQCLSVETMPTQYCLVDISVPLPPMPKFHNYYQRAKVLPDLEESLSNATMQFMVNGTFYRNLADASSVFYYAYIQMGICLPEKCTKHDVANISSKGKVDLS